MLNAGKHLRVTQKSLAAGDWWTIFNQILMTYLLLKVSGVLLLEKTLETRQAYKAYIERTSTFIPWFPKKIISRAFPKNEPV